VARRKRSQTARQLDPHRAREALKYTNPIPSREFIMESIEQFGAPLNYQELSARLELSGEEDLEALRRRLNAMQRDGQLVRNRRGAYCLVNRTDLIAGRVIAHPDGFGFLKPDAGGDDLFLSAREMRGVLHDDRAVVRVTGIDRRGRREGALVEVLERNTHQVVGRLFCEAGVGFVVPDHKRLTQEIVIPESGCSGISSGQMVVAEIVEQPTPWRQPVGRIVEVLGEHMAPGMETDVAIRAHGLPLAWPEAVEQQIAGLSPEVTEEAKHGRKDLRHLPLVTIDGADARDFDDAVYCERTPKGWRLLVCIADVSSYVMPGSALDAEARSRGNSVYFPDRVIPMLPEILSNGLCSLNPAVDRLCMACEMYVDDTGKITRSRFFEAVMRSHARLTYEEVAGILVDKDRSLQRRYAPLVVHLKELYALYRILHRSRAGRGAIDFDTTETRILFTEEKKVERIVPLVRNDAHRLIEECMLLANVAAARLLQRKRLPALYRNHEGPPETKLKDLREFLGELGLSLAGGDKPQAKDYANLLDGIQGRADAHLIQTVLLRSLSQALYSSENLGHFGLAFPAYTHFTSPIRRYPDLIVHRAIRHLLSGASKEEFAYSVPELQGLGDHCSSTERRADEATRDAVDWLKCEYMLDKVGEEYPGIISGVNSFGLFVELAEIYVTGLIHITALENDFYHFDPTGHRLTGERGGRVYRLGDPIRVRVVAVNLDDRKIDFMLAESAQRDSTEGGRRSSGLRRRRSGTRRKTPDADEGSSVGPAAREVPSGSGDKKSAKRKRRKPKSRSASGTGRKGGEPQTGGNKPKGK
jgi:ribonuclease R